MTAYKYHWQRISTYLLSVFIYVIHSAQISLINTGLHTNPIVFVNGLVLLLKIQGIDHVVQANFADTIFAHQLEDGHVLECASNEIFTESFNVNESSSFCGEAGDDVEGIGLV